jgi:hypothetical protein
MTTAGSTVPDTRHVHRAAYGLAAAAAAATLFALAPRTDAVRFVNVPLPAVAVLLVIAALGVLAARTGHSLMFAAAAGLGLGAAVLQMVELVVGTSLLGGNGSTAAFLGALGIGYGALWYVDRDNTAAPRDRAA